VSTVAAITKGRTSKVYRLRADVDPSTSLVPTDRNACRDLIEQYLDDIPAPMQGQFKLLVAAEEGTLDSLACWAPDFIDAYYAGDPLPLHKPRKGQTHVVPGDWKRMSTREAALQAVLDNRGRGVTAAEARKHTGIGGSGIGGALSLLDQAGVLARIEGEKR
jgi:hypothetical protein